jgi:cytoskeletal protein CcmA (bactofilin family)
VLKSGAKIFCNTIIIEGLVRGEIHAKTAVEIKKTGAFLGNITAKNIIVHSGGVLEGSCKISQTV